MAALAVWAAGASGALARQDVFFDPTQTETRRDFDAAMAAPPLQRLLLEEFPDDVRPFHDRLWDAWEAGDTAAIQRLGSEFAQVFLAKHRGLQKGAGDKALVDYLRAQAVSLEALEQDDVEACDLYGQGRLERAPLAAVLKRPGARGDVFRTQVVAIAEGRSSPVKREPFGPGDFQRIQAAFLAQGGDAVWLMDSDDEKTMRKPMTPAGRCRQTIILFRSILTLPPDLVGRYMVAIAPQ